MAERDLNGFPVALLETKWNDCKDISADRRVPLKIDLSNWNKATCKVAERDANGFRVDPAALVQKLWVELPECSKDKEDRKKKKEIPLKEDLENVSMATCKSTKKQEIMKLRDNTLSNKDVGHLVITDLKNDAAAAKVKKSLSQNNNKKSWVELPMCSAKGANNSEPLKENL